MRNKAKRSGQQMLSAAVAAASLLLFGCSTTSVPNSVQSPLNPLSPPAVIIDASTSNTKPEIDTFAVTNEVPVAQLLFPFLQLPEQKTARAEIEKSGISTSLVQRMLGGEIITLSEIQDLVQHEVSDDTIIKYIRTNGGSYSLTTKQIDELRAVSFSDTLLDFLLSTPTRRPVVIYLPTYYPVFRASPQTYPWWDAHPHYDSHNFHHETHHYFHNNWRH